MKKNKLSFYLQWKMIIGVKKILISFIYRGICTAFLNKYKNTENVTLVKLSKSKYYLKSVKNLQFVRFSSISQKFA